MTKRQFKDWLWHPYNLEGSRKAMLLRKIHSKLLLHELGKPLNDLRGYKGTNNTNREYSYSGRKSNESKMKNQKFLLNLLFLK